MAARLLENAARFVSPVLPAGRAAAPAQGRWCSGSCASSRATRRRSTPRSSRRVRGALLETEAALRDVSASRGRRPRRRRAAPKEAAAPRRRRRRRSRLSEATAGAARPGLRRRGVRRRRAGTSRAGLERIDALEKDRDARFEALARERERDSSEGGERASSARRGARSRCGCCASNWSSLRSNFAGRRPSGAMPPRTRDGPKRNDASGAGDPFGRRPALAPASTPTSRSLPGQRGRDPRAGRRPTSPSSSARRAPSPTSAAAGASSSRRSRPGRRRASAATRTPSWSPAAGRRGSPWTRPTSSRGSRPARRLARRRSRRTRSSSTCRPTRSSTSSSSPSRKLATGGRVLFETVNAGVGLRHEVVLDGPDARAARPGAVARRGCWRRADSGTSRSTYRSPVPGARCSGGGRERPDPLAPRSRGSSSRRRTYAVTGVK